MIKTKIDWCDSSWNPVTGCLHDCEYCYARVIANRFSGKENLKYGVRAVLNSPVCINGKNSPYPYGFKPTFHKYRLGEYENKAGRNIFVCSMADLFGEWVPDSWINDVFTACEAAPQHNYLFLTKNEKRYCELGVPNGCENMWYGVTVTKEMDMSKFNSLPAGCKTFVSIEPLLERLDTKKHNILFRQVDWVIIGAETGKRKDKIVPERMWVEEIVTECKKNKIPVFMKSSLCDVWNAPLIQQYPERLT